MSARSERSECSACGAQVSLWLRQRLCRALAALAPHAAMLELLRDELQSLPLDGSTGIEVATQVMLANNLGNMLAARDLALAQLKRLRAESALMVRDKTGCGMLDAKRALTEAEGDVDAACILVTQSGRM